MASNTLAEVIFVDSSKQNSSKQNSWGISFDSLQDALRVSKRGDEIWVVSATFKTNGKSFQTVEGVDNNGGFSGDERLINNHNSKRKTTILD